MSHRTFNAALVEALASVGRNVDPDLLRDRARKAGRQLPGVRYVDKLGANGNSPQVAYEVDGDTLHRLATVVDELAAGGSGRSRGSNRSAVSEAVRR